MLSVYSLFLLGNILLIIIALTNAITLDTDCTENTNCGGEGAICPNRKCQCDTPWYTPCNTNACIPKIGFAYEGDQCRTDANCLENAVCTSQRCKCKENYTSINKLCYKSLNVTCSRPTECWSNECRGEICQCPLGSGSREDNSRCKPKLVDLHANWTSANASGDFCYGDSVNNNCRDPNAVCQNVSMYTEKICQCRSPYTANYVSKECQLRECNGALSPSSAPIPWEDCSTCKDEHGLHLSVANQTTCWCQAGYINNNNKCEKNRQTVIFPDGSDITQHQYTLPNCSVSGNNGSVVVNNSLCTCASGYTYVNINSACRLITPTWVNDNIDYGVCTRINSLGQATANDGLCPSPLKCEARQDKHVCSCGRDKYLNENTKTCHYFLERNLTTTNHNDCPPGSILTNSRCQCTPNDLYTTSNDYRRCELNLVNTSPNNDCGADNVTYNNYCIDLYGGNTRFCRKGECRCVSSGSFYENGKCVTFVYGNPGSKDFCPLNARKTNSQCLCNTGYQAANDNRSCVPKVSQLNIIGANLTTEDCRALFLNGPVEVRNDACVCKDGSFSNTTTCIYYLMYSHNDLVSTIYCPLFAHVESGDNFIMCQCDLGYKNIRNNETCDPLTNTVYEHGDTTGTNITGLIDADCKAIFGKAAEATRLDEYCQCANSTMAFKSGNNCYFLIGITQSELTGQRSCPPGSIAGQNMCICPFGYQAVSGQRGCERKPISPLTLQSIDTTVITTACNSAYNDSDCAALYGIGAVCRNNTCYCDRARSFVRDGQCELFSKYVFPGVHERSSVTCNSQEDCGVDSDKNGIECGYIQRYETNYKVCKCKSGYLLNPSDSTCTKNRCQTSCASNEECQGYQCVCKMGYHRDPSGQCVDIRETLALYEKCNTTIWSTVSSSNEQLVCDVSCGRAECRSGYRVDGSKCVKYGFDDQCAHEPNLCSQLNSNSNCAIEENRCRCRPGYYQSQGSIICARGVNDDCSNDVDCGDLGQCVAKKCRCKEGRKEQQDFDSLGRKITRCINGVGQIRFSPILLLFFVLTRVIFA